MDLCSRLPARPLQRVVELRRRSLGMSLDQFSAYLGVTGRTLHRLMGSRWVGVFAADHMAIRLGLHPALLWPKEWTALSRGETDRERRTHRMDETLKHTKRISELLDQRKRKEAIVLHNAHVAEQIERAKAGETIDLTDLMAALETLEEARSEALERQGR